MYGTIVVPVDDVETMEPAFEHAAEIAGRRGATVHLLHVVDRRAFITLDDAMKEDVERQLVEQGDETVAAAAEWFAGKDVETATACLSGDPVEEILAYAAEVGADLLVMGTRRSDYQQSMLGSVSRKVTGSTDVPVLTVDVTDEG